MASARYFMSLTTTYMLLAACYLGIGSNASPVAHHIFDNAHSTEKSVRLELRASKPSGGTAPEIPYGTNNGLAWKAPVTLGGQKFQLMMDTGSGYPWVIGSTVPKNQSKGHSVYDPQKSQTFKNGTEPFSVAYIGDFGANGYVAYDTMTVGNLTLNNETFGVATELTGAVTYTGSDGIIGLAPTGPTSSPFVTAVFNQVGAEILTFDLRNDSTGIIDFGYVDRNLFAPGAHLTTIPLAGFGWTVPEVSVALNGKIAGSTLSGVALDTGGEVIAVADDTAQAYWAPLIANGSVITTLKGPFQSGTLYVVPCTTQLPDLTLVFGNTSSPYGNATISGETLRLTGWPRGDGSCIGSVWAYPDPWIGAPFFYQYVVAMDYGSQQVTFGPKAKH